MIKHGHFMFRWRSYLPLFLIGPLLLAFKESHQMEEYLGDGVHHIWVLFCFIFSLFGLSIRWVTVGFIPGGTSGRNTKDQRATYLNTSGMYSIVRNPLYLGNYIAILGVLLSLQVWWLVVIGSLGFFIYMERIVLAEENYLSEKFGAVYDEWRSKTPVIIPNLKLWHAPELSFSLRTVLKREYPGLLGLASAFLILEFITDVVVERENLSAWLADDFAWPVIFAIILVFTLILRAIKKNTSLFKVKGR
ncbi:MAG: isoprenylcysteine carboxylmethyltransferase family protein [Alphaproteobacteria bacterium]|nr:isoprenylcysteine carboxylmethyltransferase family protein [Alphaproteobacteria bacterium]